MSPRAAPFNCPYCAEEEIEPGPEEGTWYCTSCDRRFALRFLGTGER